jgi:hypothetical protein
MLFAEKIQTTVGKAVLNRDLKNLSRKRHIHNLNNAEKIGVIFSPETNKELKLVKSFLSYLSKLDIQVFPLAVIDAKKSKVEPALEKNINFVDRKDFNWFHKPLAPKLKEFIGQRFDILINLCMKNTLPVNFIVSQSRAELKAGRYFEGIETFSDIMIDIGKTGDLSYLIEQTSHYLSVINNKQ